MEQVFIELKKEAPFREAKQSSQMYDTLVATILDTYFVAGEDLYVNHGGMPSGTYVTTLVNILVQLWLLCLFVVSRKQRKITPKVIMAEHVLPLYMGDDLFLGVSKWFVGTFPAEEVQEFYASCNITLTNPKKTKTTISYEPLSEMEFCSRTLATYRVNGVELHAFPLKEVSVKADSHFTTHNSTETAISICRTKLMEACLHGKDFYDEECKVVQIILDEVNASGSIEIPDWEDQLERVLY
jgi:hypothetical protein